MNNELAQALYLNRRLEAVIGKTIITLEEFLNASTDAERVQAKAQLEDIVRQVKPLFTPEFNIGGKL